MSGIISARAWGKVWAYRSTFLLGLLNTVETAFFAILLSLALGVIFGLMATSGKRVLQIISRVYVEIMQNTPILLQLCFFYYALAFSGHSIGILPTGIVALGVYTGAYMAEVVRAGIEAVPKGQFEAAVSQGFTYVERMYYIIRYMLSPLQDSQCLGDPSEEKRPAGDISENRRDGDGQ